MDNRIHLEALAKNFTRENLTVLLRAASGSFRPQKEDLSRQIDNAPFIKDLVKLGSIDFADGRRLITFAGLVERELTSHSAKQKQYEIAKKVLKLTENDAGIFVFHDEAGHFRFSLITAHYKGIKREFSGFRRYTYFVSPDLSAHTFVNQIGKADFASIEAIVEAFSVEPVTKEFYKEYERIFREAEASITLDWNAEQKRLYTQRFFNRLLFLAFLERKGWMNFNARKDYLRALFADYYENETDKHTANFHRSRLNTLFFWGLNNPRGDERGDPKFLELKRRIGQVPYLNGGLFEQEADDQSWFYPDSVVLKMLNDLVYHFNFTVSESTPLDIEVAVDPEMLGKIFEELVTGRHESGSYYTPKPVVAFMCREALKGYLGTALPSEKDAALAQFVDENNPASLRNPEAVLAALRAVRVCDPACGSGAYLLGMLHVLLELRECLFVTRLLDPKTVYDRKLEIIQNNLYGVDKDVFAVNIARLRLWLSLIVDYEGANPPPLPNLDFKIEAGDSLTAPDPSGGLQPDIFRHGQVQEFLRLKNKFMSSHTGQEKKKALAAQIQDLRLKIKEWAHTKNFDPTSDAFDWQVDFAEVFAPELAESTLSGKMAEIVNTAGGQMELTTAPKQGGFDIVLANPPYVRADAQFKHIADEQERQQEIAVWRNYRTQLKNSKIYKTLYEKWDLYVPFLERGYQLLCPNGQMIFIIPDAYNAAKYAGKSHEFFLQASRMVRIDFCSEIDLFDAGVNNTILHFAKATPTADHQPVRVRRWGKRDEFANNLHTLTTSRQEEFSESLFRPDGETKSYADSKIINLDMICYISVGMAIHADEKKAQGLFKADDLVSEIQDKKHPKPYVEGKDIARWSFHRKRYLEYGTDRAPSMFRRPTFIELHEPPEKLMALRMCGENIAVAYDAQLLMSNHTVILGVPWHFLRGVTNKSIKKTAEYKHENPEGDRDRREKLSRNFLLKYILAVMNSSFAKQFLSKIRQSKTDIYPDEWKQLPIAPILLEAQQPFVEKVNAILGEYICHGYPLPPEAGQRVKDLERELDEMVARLYA